MTQKWAPNLAALSLILAMGCTSGDSTRQTDSSRRVALPHFGDQMEVIGRRFERLGRAGIARRWEFARYEQNEIRESIDELKSSPLPEDLEGLDVAQLVQALATGALPALDSALARQDSTAFRLAFRRVAQECNVCHQSAKRQFVEVPEKPGVDVPMLTPLP
jgi:hypothetical protein